MSYDMGMASKMEQAASFGHDLAVVYMYHILSFTNWKVNTLAFLSIH